MIASGRLAPPFRRRPSRSRPLIFSLLLHLLVAALLVLSVKPRQREEEFVPPAQVAMIFEHGGSPHQAAPRARLRGPPEQPQPVNRPHPLARVAPPPVKRSAPAPRPVPAPTHLALARPPPAPVPRPVPVKRPPPPARQPVNRLQPVNRSQPINRSQPVNRSQQYSVRLAPGAEVEALLQPPPLPAPRPFLLPPPLPVPPTPPRHVPPAPPAPPAPHYLVMNNMSFGGPPQGAAAPPSPQAGGLNLALNQSVMRNSFGNEFSIHGDIGPDWRAELTQWVNERKYYPEQALEMDQQGAVMIHLVIERDGTVRSVTLEQSSGSPFLDSAWLGLFEGARLPPFPPGTPASQITLDATMHYILVN